MADAWDVQGTVFKNGSATLLARVVGADGSPVVQAEIESASYTIYEIDPYDPDSGTPIEDHSEVDVDPADLIFDELQTDDLWDVDATGYNFRHVLDVSENPAFPAAGGSYRIVFSLAPVAGQIILVRFRVAAI